MNAQAAYLDALRMLARRELSEAQVRTRLGRRGHEAAAVDEAVLRLKAERNLDDMRVAAAIARVETGVRRRGRLRVRQAIERAGIATATARQVTDDTFAGLDAGALLDAALARRLRGVTPPLDERQAHRLYRSLTAQGFEPDRVRRALSPLRHRR